MSEGVSPGNTRYLYVTLIVVALVTLSTLGAIHIGPIIIGIVGGSGAVGLVGWLRTTFRRPSEPARILPLYLLTLAALMIHITEEYVTGFGPSMSEAFSINFSERTFVITFAMVGYVVWILGAVALYYRNPFGDFLCWFLFVGMVFGELTHFLFPLAEGGSYHYFSGMYTATLPLIPAVFGMRRLVLDSRKSIDWHEGALPSGSTPGP